MLHNLDCISLDENTTSTEEGAKHKHGQKSQKSGVVGRVGQEGGVYIHVSMSVNVKCTLQSSIKIELW